MTTTNSDLAAVVAALERNDKFLVTSHEAPDGDALGSLLAAHLALEKLGKDSVMFLGGPSPMPGEYTFLDLPERGLRREKLQLHDQPCEDVALRRDHTCPQREA